MKTTMWMGGALALTLALMLGGAGCGAEPMPMMDGGTNGEGDAGQVGQQDAGGNPTDAGTNPPDAGTEVTVSFANDVVPLFTMHGCTGCHFGAGGEAGLDLSGTSSQIRGRLVNVDATNPTCNGWVRVLPGDPDQSLLFRKVSAQVPAGCGAPMPPNVGLPPQAASMIEVWIEEGALDN